MKTVKLLLEIQTRPTLTAELNSLASTSERRKMWILSSGELTTTEIAAKAGVKSRAVQYFVEEASKSNLLAVPKRGYPKRLVDYIPENWKEQTELRKATPRVKGDQRGVDKEGSEQ